MCGLGEPLASLKSECTFSLLAYDFVGAMQSPAQKLADFHAFHGACGSVVEIKPGRHPSEDGHHALFAWCPACGATSREVVELAEIDIWLGSDTTIADGGREFAQAILKARQKIMSA